MKNRTEHNLLTYYSLRAVYSPFPCCDEERDRPRECVEESVRRARRSPGSAVIGRVPAAGADRPCSQTSRQTCDRESAAARAGGWHAACWHRLASRAAPLNICRYVTIYNSHSSDFQRHNTNDSQHYAIMLVIH